MTPEEILETGCFFRAQTICCTNHSKCATCGWNPRVDAERRRKLRLYGRDALQKKEEDNVRQSVSGGSADNDPV